MFTLCGDNLSLLHKYENYRFYKTINIYFYPLHYIYNNKYLNVGNYPYFIKTSQHVYMVDCNLIKYFTVITFIRLLFILYLRYENKSNNGFAG